MTCHMIEVENNLGRSLVVDLRAPLNDRFRQVDHRTIESIVFKNVKYVLKKGGKSFSEIDTNIHDGDQKWGEAAQLKVGDMFSRTSYYKTKKWVDNKNKVEANEINNNNEPVWLGIREKEYTFAQNSGNANLFDSEESVPMTRLASILTNAGNMCF